MPALAFMWELSGSNMEEGKPSGVNPFGHTSHTRAMMLSRASGLWPGTGWDTLTHTSASACPLAHGAPPWGVSSQSELSAWVS
jgi:hypothetical protein